MLFSVTTAISMVSKSAADERAPDCTQFVEHETKPLISDLVLDVRELKRGYAKDQLDALVSDYLKKNSELINEPYFQLFMGYASLQNSRYLSAIGNAEVAQFLATRNSICQIEEINFLATALRYEAISTLAEGNAGISSYLGWTTNLVSHDGMFHLDEFEPAFCTYANQILNFGNGFENKCFLGETE